MTDRKRCAACGVPLPGDTVWCFPCRHSEPTQDEPAAGVGPETHVDKAVAWDMRQKALVGERAAGFAEGVEAAAAWHDARAKLERQSGSISGALAEEYAAQAIRALTPPAAPDALLPGLRVARDAADELRLQGMRLALVEISSGPGDEVERDKHAAAKLRAEIARRGGA